jgi:hypothetical protein
MSVQASTWAWKQDVNSATKIVLLYLADLADEENSCYPGQDKIAEACGMSLRTTIRHLQTLTSLKLLETRRLGLRKTNRYVLKCQSDTSGSDKMAVPVVVASTSSNGSIEPLGPSQKAVWEAVALVFGSPTNDGERTKRSRAVKLIRQSLTTTSASEILREVTSRATEWPQRYRDATLTDMALANHWSELGTPVVRGEKKTGWRWVRGESGSGTYVKDPEGVDTPNY